MIDILFSITEIIQERNFFLFKFIFLVYNKGMDDFRFEITENLGTISEGKGGWKTELNLVSWGGRESKYDLRSWASDHQKMGKGVTFTKEELASLKKLLNSMDI